MLSATTIPFPAEVLTRRSVPTGLSSDPGNPILDDHGCANICLASPSCIAAENPAESNVCHTYMINTEAPGSERFTSTTIRRLGHADVLPAKANATSTKDAPTRWVKFVSPSTITGGFVPRGEISLRRAANTDGALRVAASTVVTCAKACETDAGCIAFVHKGSDCIMIPTIPTLSHDDKQLPASVRGQLHSTCHRINDSHLNLEPTNPMIMYPMIAAGVAILAAVVTLVALPSTSHEPIEDADELLWK